MASRRVVAGKGRSASGDKPATAVLNPSLRRIPGRFNAFGFTDFCQGPARELGIVLNPHEMMEDCRAKQQEQSNGKYRKPGHCKLSGGVKSARVMQIAVSLGDAHWSATGGYGLLSMITSLALAALKPML